MTLTLTQDKLQEEWGTRIISTGDYILRAVQHDGFLDKESSVIYLSKFVTDWRYLYSDDKGNPKDKALKADDVAAYLIKKSDALGIEVNKDGDKLTVSRNRIQGRSLADVLAEAYTESANDFDIGEDEE